MTFHKSLIVRSIKDPVVFLCPVLKKENKQPHNPCPQIPPTIVILCYVLLCLLIQTAYNVISIQMRNLLV